MQTALLGCLLVTSALSSRVTCVGKKGHVGVFFEWFFFFGLQAGVLVDAEGLSRQVWACLVLSCACRSHFQTLAFVLLSDAVGV